MPGLRRVGRAASLPAPQIVSKILQRGSHALIAEQGCAGFARCSGRWPHSLPADPGRIAPSIRPDLISGRQLFLKTCSKPERPKIALVGTPCPYQKPHPGLKRDEQHVGHRCSSSASRSLSRASRSTWSSDVGRPLRHGAPSCVTTHWTSRPWTCSLFRPLASICSMSSSSSGWPAETLSGCHVVALGEGHLRRILTKYAAYYNEWRTHRSLNKDAPIHRATPYRIRARPRRPSSPRLQNLVFSTHRRQTPQRE